MKQFLGLSLLLSTTLITYLGCSDTKTDTNQTGQTQTTSVDPPREHPLAEKPKNGEYIENYKKGESANSDKPRVIIVSHSTLDVDYLDISQKNHKEYAAHIGADYWFRNGVINKNFSDESASTNILKYGLYWQKLQAIKEALDKKDESGNPLYTYVMWMDADAYFTNFTMNIWEQIEKVSKKINDPDFIIAADKKSCVNAGVFIVKNTDAGRAVIDNVLLSYPQYKDITYPEQSALQDYLYGLMTVTNGKVSVTDIGNVQKRNCPYVQDFAKISNDKGTYVRTEPRFMNAWFGSGYGSLGGSYGDGTGRDDITEEIFKWEKGDWIAHTPGPGNKKSLAEEIIKEIVKN